MEQQNTRPRRVMIGTPCYDGRLEVWYVNSLLETVRQGIARNIEIFPIWLSYDALVQRARNDLVAIMLEMQCDDIIFIDGDIKWNPEDVFKLLEYPVDVVGGTYPKKSDEETYVVKLLDMNRAADPKTGLLQVEGLGTGFLRLSRYAVQWLWDNSEPYAEPEYNKVRRLVFNVIAKNNSLISEDIWVCQRLIEGGISIWLDTTITCDHVGTKKYTGNFEKWLANFRANIPQNKQPLMSQPSGYGNVKQNRYLNPVNINPDQVRSLYK